MSMSKNPNNYRHIKPILDAAVINNGGRCKFPSKREAIRFRLEAYQYRKILAEGGPTQYDDLVLTLSDNHVIFKIRKVSGVFYAEDGTKLSLAEDLAEPPDELLDVANALSLKLGVEW